MSKPLVAPVLIGLSAAAFVVAAAGAAPPDKFTPLTTSRVINAPEPPPPYRVVRALPELQLTSPVFAINEPGSRRLVLIEGSKIFRTVDDGSSGKTTPLLDVKHTAYCVKFHPRFAENGYIYIGADGPGKGDEKVCNILRYTLSREEPFEIVPDSRLVIAEWKSNGHNGCAVTFGLDGMLYFTTGDGTSDSDGNLTGQELHHLLAKVLRVDVDHPDDDRPYSVPDDNPFVGMENVRPETWAYGLRNPWRMTTDPQTGNIWVGNNGQDLWEQAYLVKKGDNYGWSVYEGSHPFYLNRKLGPTPHVKPTVEHPHSEFRSLTGGVVYHGQKFPDLQGAYIYGDYSTGKIWGAKHDGERMIWHRELADTTLAISAFALDADGELLVVDHRGDKKGGLYTFESNEGAYDPAAFPRKLSETGLFKSVANHEPHDAMIPYSVNAALWSDGAHKDRYIAIVDPDAKIGYSETTGWNFPDQTVLVKSFALEREEGNVDSRRWIETRLLTKQQNEWVGYSYAWNDEQTDATLVAKEGADAEFTLQTSTGSRKQPWRFPSRAECMVCHSRAANYVLGLTGVQMNKRHDYGDGSENQLTMFERIGLLKLPKPAGELKHLVDPYDATADLEQRARSYLHANCAQCHVGAGGGNAQFDVGFAKSLADTKLVDVKPLHHTYGIDEPRLIAPGAPQRSLLLQRIAKRGAGQMPQLATTRVDEPAVALIREWIKSIPAKEVAPSDE